MRFKKQLITLLGAVLLGSNLNVSTVVAADAAVDSNTTTTTTEPEKKTYKWAYPFKACDKYGIRPMSKAQTFGMTDYMRSVNPPSYFHDGWKLATHLFTLFMKIQLRKLLMVAA